MDNRFVGACDDHKGFSYAVGNGRIYAGMNKESQSYYELKVETGGEDIVDVHCAVKEELILL